ncbi:MAG: acyltransferase family protein [Ilumatobacteraceae bacterium]
MPSGHGLLPFQPALDGLRAIAVVAVVAYHLELPGATGGFLGVDLFFVVSGYLITTLLLREHDVAGRIHLRGFWNRRFRRLVPPLVVVTAAVVGATRAWGVPEQWASIRADAVAALTYVANWRFIVDEQSYFESSFAPSPLRHTWSLAVEEQWYLIWPMVVLVLARCRRSTSLMVVAGVSVVSAVAMSLGHDPADSSTVYYGTHTRAQQLLVGSLLAWWLHRAPERISRRDEPWHRVAGVVALGGFLALVVVVSDGSSWLYHGGFLVVSLWCAVLVHAVASADGGSLPELARRPLRRLGERSYSIYLWHWPVIVFVGPPSGVDVSRPVLVVLQIVVIAAATEATHRLVERPLRNRGAQRLPWRATLSWSVAAALLVVAIPLALRTPDDRVLASVDSVRPTVTSAPVTSTRSAPGPIVPDPSVTVEGTSSAALATGARATATTSTVASPAEPAPRRRMLLFGDSTALAVAMGATITPEIAPGWHAEAHATIGCALTPGQAVDVGRTEPTTSNAQCAGWVEEWAASAALVEPDVAVLMVGAWEILDHLVGDTIIRHPSPEWFELISMSLEQAIDVAHGPSGTSPVLLVELPCMRQEPNDDFSAVARNDSSRVAAFNAIVRSLAADDPLVRTVDVADLFCADGTPIDEVDGEALRFDGVHATPFAADLTWRRFAERADALFPRTDR